MSLSVSVSICQAFSVCLSVCLPRQQPQSDVPYNAVISPYNVLVVTWRDVGVVPLAYSAVMSPCNVAIVA